MISKIIGLSVREKNPKCGGHIVRLPVTVQKFYTTNTIADNIVYYTVILLAIFAESPIMLTM